MIGSPPTPPLDEAAGQAHARVGEWLRDKYRLDRVLGIGGMATVYEATHRNGRRFAVKVLHTEISVRSELRARFLREGYAANRVMHAGTVAVLDDDVARDGSAFLVMELLDGASLDEVHERCGGRLPVRDVLAIACAVLDVLDAAHARGVIHRDIKPGNVFVTRDGRVKVLDFGIARWRQVEVAGSGATQTGMMLGTPAFMSPEQALGRAAEIDGRSDVWAVGAMLYNLLTGASVHEGETAQEILVRAATQTARTLRALAPDAPASAVTLVDRALAFHRNDRWPSALEMLTAARKVHEELFDGPPSTEPLRALLPSRDATGVSSASSQGSPALPSRSPETDPTCLSPSSPSPPSRMRERTTSSPVASDPTGAAPLAPRRRAIAVIGATAAVLVLGFAIARGTRAPGDPSAHVTADASPSATPAAAIPRGSSAALPSSPASALAPATPASTTTSVPAAATPSPAVKAAPPPRPARSPKRSVAPAPYEPTSPPSSPTPHTPANPFDVQ